MDSYVYSMLDDTIAIYRVGAALAAAAAASLFLASLASCSSCLFKMASSSISFFSDTAAGGDVPSKFKFL